MKIKRNKKSYKWFLCGLILVVVLTISYRVSKANYRISNSIELTTGKVISSPYDFNIVSMYIDGIEQDKDTIIPDSGYAINEEQSYCYKESKNNKDNNARLFTDSLGNHVFKGISKGSKCIIYFDKTKTMEELLNNYYTDKRIRTSENKDFNIPYEETTTRTIFSAPDDNGTSYYFAGNPTDNWVEFGRYYWRIIRINEDGTIRMIYQGRTEDESGNKLEPQAIGEETQITVNESNTFAFNNSYNNNAYVGYWHEIGVLRGLQNPSNAYTQLNNWFNNSNLKQSENFNKIDLNAGFCGDRTPSSSATPSSISGGINVGDGKGGIGTTTTYYGALIRLLPGKSNPTTTSTSVTPTFKCGHNDDLYTYSGANQGNKRLANPVGLITADEASYAGLVYNTASLARENYLNTKQHYWTMSPYYANSAGTSVEFIVDSTGCISGGGTVHYANGIRPTINLKKDVTFTGNGTISNPYKVIS